MPGWFSPAPGCPSSMSRVFLSALAVSVGAGNAGLEVRSAKVNCDGFFYFVVLLHAGPPLVFLPWP